MLYRKNLYQWEQWSRVAIGVTMIVWGLFFAQMPLVGYIVAAGGATLAVTGVVGWCPACAMIGRRLKDDA
jgi:Protein of unknown function (DUF2892)